MLTKEQLKILGAFRKDKDIFISLTFREIKEKSSQNSNNIIQLALKQFQKENLIKTNMVGDVSAYSLNLDNNLTLSYLNLINELDNIDNKKLPKKTLKDIQNRISKYTEFFILLVFGSYAENKATSKSDLDIAVIIETEQSKKEITPFLETIKRREIISIDYQIFTRNEFIEMLETDEENIGKEIYRKNIINYGLIEYHNMIKRIRHERIG